MPTPDADISIRDAALSDADAIVELEASGFIDDEHFSLRQIRRLISNPRAICIVAQSTPSVSARALGWAVALTRSHQHWQSGRVYTVAVAHPAKGRGIGRLLVQSLLDRLRVIGVDRVYLEVRADNDPAIKLYESLGFEPIALLGDYYGDGLHGIRMRRLGDCEFK